MACHIPGNILYYACEKQKAVKQAFVSYKYGNDKMEKENE